MTAHYSREKKGNDDYDDDNNNNNNKTHYTHVIFSLFVNLKFNRPTNLSIYESIHSSHHCTDYHQMYHREK
jgi:hypothetical protein